MSWARVDDSWYDHPKVAGCSMAARGAWITLLTWSCKHATDGVIPLQAARTLGVERRHLAELQRRNLVILNDQEVTLPNFTRYNPTKADRDAARRGAAERQKKARAARASRCDEPVSHDVTQELVTRDEPVSHVAPGPARPQLDLPDHERAKDGCPRGAPSEPDELARSEVRPRSAEPPPPVVRRVEGPSSTRLTADWTPTVDELGGVGAPSGAPAEYVADQLLAFRGHFCPRSDEDTHHGWVSRFTGWVGRGWARDRTRWRRERETDALRSVPVAARPAGPPPAAGAVWSDTAGRWEWPPRNFGVPERDAYEHRNRFEPWTTRDRVWEQMQRGRQPAKEAV